MIISASVIQYNIYDIQRALDTKISELSADGVYDFLPYPTYDVQSPYTAGPFWKGDTMLIKWNYTEALNNLIPSTSIYLMSASSQTLLFNNVPTDYKNINWKIPNYVKNNTKYFIKVESNIDNQIISDVSPTFTFDARAIEITSPIPILPIQANQGEQHTFKWIGHGTSDYFRIELIEPNSSSIAFENKIGRLIRNQDPANEGEIIESNEPLIYEMQSAKIIKVLEDKYYTTDGTYIWIADGIEDYTIDKVQLRITDVQYGTTTATDDMTLNVAHISVAQVGQSIQLDLTGPSVITGSGPGSAEISAYDFNPSNFIVSTSKDFTFQYTSTNAIRVYLKKESDQYYYEEIGLSGQHVITNITKDEKYTLNAQDSNQLLKTAVLDIKLQTADSIVETDITKFTSQELLVYAASLMKEVQSSGDAIIETAAPINGKISFYTIEASQTTPESDERAVWYLLKSLNEDVLLVFIAGVAESPKVLLFDGTILKDKVIALNQEIGRRYNILITVPYTVFGYVYKDNGIQPLQGVSMAFTSIGTFPTNADGYYEALVPYNYSGSVSPGFEGYIFNPVSISYLNSPIKGETENPPFRGIPKSPPATKTFILKVSGVPADNMGTELGSVLDKQNQLDLVIFDNGIQTANMDADKFNEIYVYLTYEAWNRLATMNAKINGVNVPTNEIIVTDDNKVYPGGKKYTIFVEYSNSTAIVTVKFDMPTS